MTVFQVISTLGITFALNIAVPAPLPVPATEGIDWLYVTDLDGDRQMVDDGDPDCITVIIVHEDGNFDTYFVGDDNCN